MKKTRSTAILLAAGKGLRVGGDTRKQYLEIGGAPLLLHAVRALAHHPVITDAVLVVPKGDEEACRQILADDGIKTSGSVPADDKAEGHMRIISGGAERYLSVARALESVTWPCDYVFIHDCARPFIDAGTITRLYETVCADGPCAAGMPVKDTIKITDESGVVEYTPDRSRVWAVQTPQVFPYELITEAHRKLLEDPEEIRKKGVQITDDAMVAEYVMGCRVKMVEASYQNIKVTTPEDLLIAEAFFGENVRK